MEVILVFVMKVILEMELSVKVETCCGENSFFLFFKTLKCSSYDVEN